MTTENVYDFLAGVLLFVGIAALYILAAIVFGG